MEAGTLVWVRDNGPEAWLAGVVLSKVRDEEEEEEEGWL